MSALAWITLLHTLLFGLFWLTNAPYQQEVNAFLANTTGWQLGYISIFLVFSLLVLLGSLSVLGLAAQSSVPAPQLYLGLYFLLATIYLVLFYASFAALFRQDPTQLTRLYLLAQYFRLLPDILLLFLLAWLAGRWVLPSLANLLPALTAQLVVLALLAGVWFIPLLNAPGNVIIGRLPSRPRLIAHRGAAWLAPENTLAAMQRAVELGVFGLESDVHISLDGIPFLMHDATLKRTTDIAEVFPQRTADPAYSFTWSELQKLNTGRWFTDQDPFRVIANGLTPASAIIAYAKESIPSLSSLLDTALQGGKVVMYDLYDPPDGHPYHGQALQISLDALANAQLAENAWVLADPAEIPQVRSILPRSVLVAGVSANNPPTADDLQAQGYQVVNSEYPLSNQAIQGYRKAGLWVNIWTVDETWLYSRLWLLDVDSVTSNNVHILQTLKQPVLALPFFPYLVMWTIVGLLAAFVLHSSGLEAALKTG